MAGGPETREEQTALRLVNGWPKVRDAMLMLDAGGAGESERVGARAVGRHA